MNTDLHKRLEEAAEKYCTDNGLLSGACASQISYGHSCMHDGFIAGAELGYKEAINVAKEWLKNFLDSEDCEYLDNSIPANEFETAMNKLWEEQK